MIELDIKNDIIKEKVLKEIDKTKKHCKKQKKVLEELLNNEYEIQIVLMINPKGEKDGNS